MKKLIVFITAIFSLTIVKADFGTAQIIEAAYTLKDGTFIKGFVVFNNIDPQLKLENDKIEDRIFNQEYFELLKNKFATSELDCELIQTSFGEVRIYENISLLPSFTLPGDASAYSRIPLANVDDIHTFDLCEIEELELLNISEAMFNWFSTNMYLTTKEVIDYIADNNMVNHQIRKDLEMNDYFFLLNYNPYNNAREIDRLFELYKKALLSKDDVKITNAVERLERRGIIPLKVFEGC